MKPRRGRPTLSRLRPNKDKNRAPEKPSVYAGWTQDESGDR